MRKKRKAAKRIRGAKPKRVALLSSAPQPNLCAKESVSFLHCQTKPTAKAVFLLKTFRSHYTKQVILRGCGESLKGNLYFALALYNGKEFVCFELFGKSASVYDARFSAEAAKALTVLFGVLG